MAKKKPSFDVDAAMKAEGISLDGFDVDAAMKAEGITAPAGDRTAYRPSRAAAPIEFPEPEDERVRAQPEVEHERIMSRKPTLGTRLFAGITGQDPHAYADKIERLKEDTKPREDGLPSTGGAMRTSQDVARIGRMVGSIPLGAGAAGATERVLANVPGANVPLLSNVAAGATASAGMNVGTGKDAGQVAKEAGTDATIGGAAGAALAKLFGWLGVGGKAVADKIEDPRTRTGQLKETLDRTAEYRKTPEYQELQEGAAGIGQQAHRQGEALGDLQAKKYRGANKKWRKAHDAIPDRDVPRDVSPVVNAARGQVKTFSNARVANNDVAAIADDVTADLSRKVPQGHVDPEMRTNHAPAADASIATLDDLILEKEKLKDLAEWGVGETKENRPYREMYRAIVARVGKVSPEMAKADQAFMRRAKVLEEVNDIVFGSAEARAVQSSSKARTRGANFLRQGLADTSAGAVRIEELNRLRAKGPEYEEIVDKVLAKIADESTKFAAVSPSTFGHPGKWATQILGQNKDAAAVRLAHPLGRGAERMAADAAERPFQVAPFFSAMSRGARAQERR